jgi:hypothetical protein
MKNHWSFLKDGESSFGMFYPLHYTLAGFTDAGRAELAVRALRDAGFQPEDVHLITGSALIDEIEGIVADSGWLERIRARISDFIGTETYFIDQDLTLAKEGGVFVLVYTPDGGTSHAAESALKCSQPSYARRYLRMAVERIIEPASTHDVEMRMP